MLMLDDNPLFAIMNITLLFEGLAHQDDRIVVCRVFCQPCPTIQWQPIFHFQPWILESDEREHQDNSALPCHWLAASVVAKPYSMARLC
jgi:hypothetical protein